MKPELYNGLMIATVVSPAIPHPFPGKNNFASQRVRVEDSREFRKGTVVDIYFRSEGPSSDGAVDQRNAMPVGAHLLIAAQAPKNGILEAARLPFAENDSPPDQLPVGKTASAFGIAYFATSQPNLSHSPEPMWQFLESLAQAIPSAGDEDARRIVDVLDSVRLPTWAQDGTVWRADDRLSKVFSLAVAKDIAYHRAIVDYALNDLRYLGYSDRFYRDLMDSAEYPDAFPNGVPPLENWEAPTGGEDGVPNDFRHAPAPTTAELMSILTRSKSPTVAVALLDNMPKPSTEEIRSLARFLDSPDVRLRYAFVERLSAWNGEPGPEPPKQHGPQTIYPGLDDAVARWKTRLAAL